MNSAQAQAQLMVENTDLIQSFSGKRSKKRMGEERRTIKRKNLKKKRKKENIEEKQNEDE